MRRRRGRRVWQACTSLSDLSVATVRWLSGELRETPGHLGPPDPETGVVVGDLLALNRAGLVTIGSQPGHDARPAYDGRLWVQRAFVEGYSDRYRAARIAAHCGDAGLICEVRAVTDLRRRDRGEPVDVSMHDQRPCTSVPAWTQDIHAEVWGRWVSEAAWDALQRSFVVTVVDPAWGRERALWDTLRDALSCGDEAAA